MKHGRKLSVELAETILKRCPDPDQYPYQSWSYSQGFMLWGFIRLWEETGDKRYFDYVMRYAEEHVDADGSISGFTGVSMDDVMAGSVLVWAFVQTGHEKYRLACDSIRKVFDTYPRMSDGGFWHGSWCPQEMWVDGLFMGQMFLAKYGKYVADSEYCFSEAAKQLETIYRHCRKGNTGLLVHAWTENKKVAWADPETGCSPEVWSEGLGWYAMILVEVLSVFPESHPERAKLHEQLDQLFESLRDNQDPVTGLWCQVVDKGDLPDNWNDTSGSAMFLYAIKKSIDLGISRPEIYDPVVEKGYQGLLEKAVLNEDGLVDIYDACDGLCVQANYKIYVDYEKVVNAKEAVAACLWAATIIEKPRLGSPEQSCCI